MATDEHDGGESGAGVTRGVLVIVVAGIALGRAFNQLLHASGPKRGLAWIKVQTRLASLEDSPAVEATDSTPPAGAPTTSAAPSHPATTSPGASAGVATSAAATRAATPAAGTPPAPAHRGSGHAESPVATKPAAGHAEAPAATPPAPAATTPPPASAGAEAATQVALPVIPETREPLEVKYATIKKFWDANAAVFVDARSASDYAEGHIPGAVSLPFDDVFRDPDLAKKFDAGGKPVITYCSGGDCDLSRNLATSLIEAGQKRVLVFVDGMPGWKDGGNAVATGTSPGGASR